jgi:hypothetical protein
VLASLFLFAILTGSGGAIAAAPEPERAKKAGVCPACSTVIDGAKVCHECHWHVCDRCGGNWIAPSDSRCAECQREPAPEGV